MKVRKTFKMQFGGKLPNGVFVNMDFGTEIEEEDIDPKELLQKVYDGTFDDIKETIKKDPTAKFLWEEFKNGLKLQKRFREAEKDL